MPKGSDWHGDPPPEGEVGWSLTRRTDPHGRDCIKLELIRESMVLEEIWTPIKRFEYLLEELGRRYRILVKEPEPVDCEHTNRETRYANIYCTDCGTYLA